MFVYWCCLCSLKNKRLYNSWFHNCSFLLLHSVRRKQPVEKSSVPSMTPLSLRWDRDMSSLPFTKRYVTVVVLHSATRCWSWTMSAVKTMTLSKSLFVFLWANSTTWALSGSVCSTMLDNGQIDDGYWTKLHYTPVHCSCFSYPLHKSLHKMTFGSTARLENSLKNSPL